MKREQKYPDTESFVFHNQNPHNRFTTDCVIRAISAATEIPYNQVVMEMAELPSAHALDTLSELPGIIRIRTFAK